MQAQSIRQVCVRLSRPVKTADTSQETVTAGQSLSVVQTLLRAGFGCVTYLRGLLPDENFTESNLGSCYTVFPSNSQENSYSSPTSVKLKTIKKGWSPEGDRLLQYLVENPQEEGIFDALERQYLRSFVFAIYLYHDVSGMTTKVPVMTLNEKLDRLSLGAKGTRSRDPVVQAIAQGKQPTLAELKQSVKYLVRSLIAAVQTLNSLPRHRFVTFKLFYTDSVPDDYEPPHFSRGDSDKRYFFCTHSVAEAPEEISIGSLRTPYHCLDLRINSISDIIPQGNENDDTQGCTFAEAKEKKREEVIKLQQADVLLRKVVWDAESFINPRADANAPRASPSNGLLNNRLITTLDENASSPHLTALNLTPTQVLETDRLITPQPFSPRISNVDDVMESAVDIPMGQNCDDVSTQALTNFLLNRDADRDQFSSPLSQPSPPPSLSDGANSFDFALQRSNDSSDSSDDIDVNCDCSVNEEESAEVCQCEGPCERWFHIWCLGYHSSKDDRLPSTFWCFSCRLRNDPEIEILDSRNLTSQYITKYKDLCLFRRAIKIALTRLPENVSEFTKLLGTEISTAAQTWKRLEAEGFIHPETRGKAKSYGKNKNRNGKRGIKPLRYIPAIDIEKSQKFKDYFDPTKEALLIGMSKVHVHKQMINKGERRRDDLQIQDQVDSSVLDLHTTNKRKNGDYDDLCRKRNKVSIAEPIDLEE